MRSVLLLVAACSSAPPIAPPAAAVAPTAAPVVVAVAPAPWTPIPTAVADRDGCRVDARSVAFDLSVDGTPDGVFVHHVTGTTGEIIVAPGRVSAARIAFGAVDFDTAVALAETEFALAKRPARIGAILDPAEWVRVRVVGGNAARLTLQVPSSPRLAWVTPPTFEVPCAAIGAASWDPKPDAGPSKPARAVAETATIAVRATIDGPVIAHVTGIRYVTPLETKGSSIRVTASVDVGDITGWVAAAELVPPPPTDDERDGGPGGGSLFMPNPKVRCEPGTPFYVRKAGKLYAVGTLSRSTTTPASGDWRFDHGKIVLDGARRSTEVAADAPWLAVTDTLNVTNAYGSNSVDGLFVVPKSACTLTPAR